MGNWVCQLASASKIDYLWYIVSAYSPLTKQLATPLAYRITPQHFPVLYPLVIKHRKGKPIQKEEMFNCHVGLPEDSIHSIISTHAKLPIEVYELVGGSTMIR